MFVDRIKSPRCPKCGAMMLLQIIEPESPGFDSRTFECPKCYDTQTFVAAISGEINVSLSGKCVMDAQGLDFFGRPASELGD
jgi:hypothetical protein